MQGCLVVADRLVKVYRNGVVAVDGVSFRAGRGITVLMGPNGSGKTTTLSMVAGALKPTSGKVLVCGHDVWGSGWYEARARIGYAPQDMPFRELLTALENLVWLGLMRGQSLGAARRRGLSLLEAVGLRDKAHTRVTRLSGGMKRRLAIAAALMGDPEVLVLDEPTSGLDPGARRQLWNLLEDLSRDRILLASTHIASEAEEHAGQVLIFHRGRIVASGDPASLVERYAPVSRVIIEGDLPGEPAMVEGAEAVRADSRRHIYASRAPDRVLPVLVETLARSGRVERVEVRRPGLEEVYLALTGEVLGGEAGG